MVLIDKLMYEPLIDEIRKEEEAIQLISDVRNDIQKVDFLVDEGSLKKFLEFIENGKYEIQDTSNGVQTIIDLSKAQNLINDYRRLSKGGCQSCEHIRAFKPLPDETVKYCNLYEDKNTVDEGFSPKIKEFYKNGCDEKKPIFRQLEKVLKDM